ncbi:MAG: clan AA aspartic protease [Nitrospirae bacterium]|nr:clan AA aspartic protease [Nitrospirota bacterium]
MVLKVEKIILAAMLSLFFILPANAGDTVRQGKSRVYTNEDLEKYNDAPSASTPAEKPETYDYRQGPDGPKDAESAQKKFVVPYSGGARRIIIPVTFNRRVTANMLLDTGAPGMHISYRLAERIGLVDDRESILWVMIGGIGGTVPAIFTIVDSIRVGEAEDNFIPTYVSPQISSEFDGLIGMDFMANYSMKVDTNKRVVIFEEIPENLNNPAGHDETWWRTTFSNFKSIRQSWQRHREKLLKQGSNTDREKRLRESVERQCMKADELYDRLSVYASTHAVPREWR